MNVAIIACSILFTNRAAKGWDGSNLESVYVDDEAVRVDVNNRIKRGIDCDEGKFDDVSALLLPDKFVDDEASFSLE